MKKKVLQRITVMMAAMAAVCLLFGPVDSKAEKTGKASMTWKVVEQDDGSGTPVVDEPKITSGYTGLVETENGIFWAANGSISKTKTDIVKDTIGVTPDAGWLYLINGAFDATQDTVAKNANGWWKIRDGLVDFNYTGLAKNDNGWWYIQDGKVNFDYNGAAQNENAIWYVKGGAVDFNFNGAAYGYYFTGGKAQ